ncbi:MAG: DUF6133 family protein [Oscillospiraceae bacterium]
MKKAMQKIDITLRGAIFRAKAALSNNKGMEVVQVLVIVIIAITLGALLLSTLKAEFATQLRTVGTKLSDLFS